MFAGLLGVCAGLLTADRGQRWPAMGRRYERTERRTTDGAPPGRRPTRTGPSWAWRALDRGEDPTDPAPGGRA